MAEFLKWTEIPAYICEGLSDHEARMLNLVENLQRKSLNILEEARAIQNLYPEGRERAGGGPRAKAADAMGLGPGAAAADAGSDPAEGRRRAALPSEPGQRWRALNGTDEQITAADKIVEARQRGKGKFLPGLDKTYKRRRGVRPREEINRMIERMLAAGIGGLPPRVAAWCAGPFRRGVVERNRGSDSRKCRNSVIADREESDERADGKPVEPGIDIRKLKAGHDHPLGGGPLPL